MFEHDSGLHIGTSSWSARDWVGGFYPPGTPPHLYIAHYATVFDTVEIDATFYRMPTDRNVAAWRERTPEGFRFSAKTPRIITHEKVLVDAVGDMTVFLETMEGLGDRLGPLVLQFPYFNRKAFPGPEPFRERLDGFLAELPERFRYVVEVRNPRWVGPELATVCRRHRACLAWVDQAWMPPPAKWPELTGGPTTDFAYVRWLGDHKAIEKITTSWDEIVIDRSGRLEEWIPVLRELRAGGVDVFGYFNNHFAGNAPATIEVFRELWRKAFPPRAAGGVGGDA